MIFDTVSFDAKDFTGSQVFENYLYIYTTKRVFDIEYTDVDAALNAQYRLEKVIGLAKPEAQAESKPSWQRHFSKAVDSVRSKLNESSDNLLYQMAADAVVGSVKNKVEKLHDDLDEAISKVKVQISTKMDSVNLGEIVDEVLSILDKDEEPKPMATRNPPKEDKRKPVFEFNSTDAFGGADDEEETVAPKIVLGTPDEPLIEDMSMSELEEAISKFVDDSVSNPKVQEIFEQLKNMVGDEGTKEAIASLKMMMVQVALSNPQKRLSEVITMFFM